jgi:hypothetical protein
MCLSMINHYQLQSWLHAYGPPLCYFVFMKEFTCDSPLGESPAHRHISDHFMLHVFYLWIIFNVTFLCTFISSKLPLSIRLKVKSVCPNKHHTMKIYCESVGGGIAPCILNLGTCWKWVVSLTSPPPEDKSRWYSLDRRLGGPQRRSGRGGEEKNISSLPLPEVEPRSSSP